MFFLSNILYYFDSSQATTRILSTGEKTQGKNLRTALLNDTNLAGLLGVKISSRRNRASILYSRKYIT